MSKMKYVMIAPAGDNLDALFIGIRDFPTEKVILLTPPDRASEAKEVKHDLERFKIPAQLVEIKGSVWEETFKKIAEFKDLLKGKEIIINTATGDRSTTCAATSAAFVNGLKAMSVEGNETMLLPVLKFSYYRLLSDKKMKILEILAKDKTCCKSLDELGKRSKMSLPLISYHINGNIKSEGLVDLGLVETTEIGGKTAITLTMLGRLLIKGYVKAEN
jgi:DNA-binding transcriptional ArsR family regulator